MTTAMMEQHTHPPGTQEDANTHSIPRTCTTSTPKAQTAYRWPSTPTNIGEATSQKSTCQAVQRGWGQRHRCCFWPGPQQWWPPRPNNGYILCRRLRIINVHVSKGLRALAGGGKARYQSMERQTNGQQHRRGCASSDVRPCLRMLIPDRLCQVVQIVLIIILYSKTIM